MENIETVDIKHFDGSVCDDIELFGLNTSLNYFQATYNDIR